MRPWRCRTRPLAFGRPSHFGSASESTPHEIRSTVPSRPRTSKKKTTETTQFRFIDLFAGIGGIRIAFESIGGNCVFTSEWNKYARQTYGANFAENPGHEFAGDITDVDAADVPDHDVLLAGFPCQPFSIAGVSKKNALGRAHGFQDETQGTLFFDVARIIDEKRPAAFLLENVRNLRSHDKGRTFEVIQRVLREDLGYDISFRVMDARPWVPQGRQRIIIVGYDANRSCGQSFDFDKIDVPDARPTMVEVLDPAELIDQKYILTANLWRYLREYKTKHNAAGNGFGYGLVGPDDVARTLSARYHKDGSEVLVRRGTNARPRRLTPRECARLMGFPDTFVIPVSDTQAYRQFGNSVVVKMIGAVAAAMQPDIAALVNGATVLPSSARVAVTEAHDQLEFTFESSHVA